MLLLLLLDQGDEVTVSYSTPTDFKRIAVRAAGLGGKTDAEIQAELSAMYMLINGYICNAYSLPLTAWSEDLKRIEIDLAAYNLLGGVGFQPEANRDPVTERYASAMKRLREIAKGEYHLQGIADSSTTRTTLNDTGFTPETWSDEDRGIS